MYDWNSRRCKRHLLALLNNFLTLLTGVPVPKSKSLSTSMDKLPWGVHYSPSSRGSTPSSGRSSVATSASRPPSRKSPATQPIAPHLANGTYKSCSNIMVRLYIRTLVHCCIFPKNVKKMLFRMGFSVLNFFHMKFSKIYLLKDAPLFWEHPVQYSTFFGGLLNDLFLALLYLMCACIFC